MSKKSTYDALILGVLGFGLGIGISLVEHQPACDTCVRTVAEHEVTASLLNYSPSYFVVRSIERKKAAGVAVVSELHMAADEEVETNQKSEIRNQNEITKENVELIPEPETAPVEEEKVEPIVVPVLEPEVPETVSEEVPEPAVSDFPVFSKAIYPISKVPNWGAMRTPAEWNRKYGEMTANDFVKVPPYDLTELTIPLLDLAKRKDDPAVMQIITAKLFYSTRFFGKYDLDSGEFAGVHAGVDLKLALGTPVSALAGGRVNVTSEIDTLGKFVVIEHRIGEETFYSVYGHLGSIGVAEGQEVAPGQVIGSVGMTGNTSAAHLHLQVDRGAAGEAHHTPYAPNSLPSTGEAARFSINPISFISRY